MLVISKIKKVHDRYGNPEYIYKAYIVYSTEGEATDVTEEVAKDTNCRYSKANSWAKLQTYAVFEDELNERLENCIYSMGYVAFVG